MPRQFLRRAGALLVATVAALLLAPTAATAGSSGGLTAGPLYGGVFMTGSGYTCPSAFNARAGGSYYVITAGSCSSLSSNWYIGSDYLGATVASNFPGDNYGLIRVTNAAWLPQPAILSAKGPISITGYGTPPAGSQVCTTNEQSQVYCAGNIWATNVTVSLPGVTLTGMTEVHFTNCINAVIGSPVFAGSTAVGIVAGVATSCSPGTTMYYQPIGEVMNAYGLSLV